MVLTVELGIEHLKVYPRESRIAVKVRGSIITTVIEHL
jgi:hypothetical protein